MTTVTVWNEYRQEREQEEVAEVYPDGIHVAVADALDGYGFDTRTATLDEPEHGLTEEVLDGTDVLLWWGHEAHDEVTDEVVDRVQERVLEGMGFVVLHSAHFSKPFRRLMGTSGSLEWRETGERERVWTIEPGHPIAAGVDGPIELPRSEMYGEPFDVPRPEATVFTSWFEGGEVFRSGCCWTRGNGRVFYFRPGHETYPIYHDGTIQRVLANACEWVAGTADAPAPEARNVEPREPLED
ncbi:ThuA domain-containing protein [Halorarum halophilum]|uniref:ThuA domain-containing protein n=1 Tax=Halorarum halophilum TaxID=2743090 RepID=A0A7D5GGH8_9EURY|nr:ThuA domain-containing protein [Halobaculum halophilum]QLG26811.1 ThuA domain-containing protein [Halobaculum halophilum]